MAYELFDQVLLYTRKNEVHHREPTPDDQLLGSVPLELSKRLNHFKQARDWGRKA